jgi:hypothetical protein
MITVTITELRTKFPRLKAIIAREGQVIVTTVVARLSCSAR